MKCFRKLILYNFDMSCCQLKEEEKVNEMRQGNLAERDGSVMLISSFCKRKKYSFCMKSS
jgi:hypothetical protein